MGGGKTKKKQKKGTREINLDEGQRPKSLQTKETRRTKILEKEGTGRQRRERRAMAKGKKETPIIKILEKEETESQRRERRAKGKEETPKRIKILQKEETESQRRERRAK